ncbi:MAG: yegE, partial [Tardiphaga sp.]|nr:yegE [Tardiphaga sp.]
MKTPKIPPHLFRSVWPFTAIVLLQAFLAGISMETLTSVRAYVVGESLWSKGQKEAIYSLSLYAETGEAKYYRRYQSTIAVPLGDRIARRALEQPIPDPKLAYAGFLQGGNHPEDIPGMIWLFRNFSEVSYLSRAIESWRETDAVIQELVDIAAAVHADVLDGRVGSMRLAGRKSQIDDINERTTPLAVAFSTRLGVGSRAIKSLLMIANLLTAALLVLLGIWRTRHLLIQRLRFEFELKTEKERAQVTLSSIGEAVISTDVHGCVEYMNPTAERLVATDVANAQGRKLSSLFRIVDQAKGLDRDEDSE